MDKGIMISSTSSVRLVVCALSSSAIVRSRSSRNALSAYCGSNYGAKINAN